MGLVSSTTFGTHQQPPTETKTMNLFSTFTALTLSIAALTGTASANTQVDASTSQPTLEAQDTTAAAVNTVYWQDWCDGYGIWHRTYSEYNYCGHLVRRWTVCL